MTHELQAAIARLQIAVDDNQTSVFLAQVKDLNDLIADHARLGAIVAKLTEALKQHHDWHQKQNETYCDETSYTKAEAYSCSGLCDTTIAALAASSEGGSGDVQKH